ncbi:MAG: 4Fe-4S cluster-binding domain-containing protein [Nitrospirae bacterium]|nr:4Fe-4S cluster-binding domain-containing protein [Nitrospirota bacterium]
MRRIKVLLSDDGRFYLDDIDAELYKRLLKAGASFEEDINIPTLNCFSGKNLKRRLKDAAWWNEYLDYAIKWAEDSYNNCSLCHLKCGKNRFLQTGQCNASLEGEFFDLFVHPEMNGLKDVLHIMMKGCSLDCFFCHKDQERDRESGLHMPTVRHKEVVAIIKKGNFNSAAFSGGNPDENILSILRLLKEVGPFKWPIIWETHGCIDTSVFSMLLPIVDLFLVTVKFGSDECACKYGGVAHYRDCVSKTLLFLKSKKADFFLRISRIPEHEECCYLKAKEMIDKLGIRDYSIINIYPEFNLSYREV